MRLFFILFLLIISGCGFKLRGLEKAQTNSPAQDLVVNVKSSDDYFRQQIKQQLSLNNINIIDGNNIANKLYIDEINIKATQVALSNVNLTRAYERKYSVLVSLNNHKEEQLNQQTVSTTELVETNDSRVLASQENIQIADNLAKRKLVQKLLFFIKSNARPPKNK